MLMQHTWYLRAGLGAALHVTLDSDGVVSAGKPVQGLMLPMCSCRSIVQLLLSLHGSRLGREGFNQLPRQLVAPAVQVPSGSCLAVCRRVAAAPAPAPAAAHHARGPWSPPAALSSLGLIRVCLGALVGDGWRGGGHMGVGDRCVHV